MNPHKRLYRSHTDRMIAGVAGGIAEYLDTDSTLVRLAVVLLTFAGGAGILAYIVAMIVMPEAPPNPQAHAINKEDAMPHDAPPPPDDQPHPHSPHSPHDRRERSRSVAGLILIALGVTLYLQLAYDINLWRYSGPIALIVIGLLLMLRRR